MITKESIKALEGLTPDVLTQEEVEELLPALDELITWAKLVKEYALEQALNNNVSYKGFRLVEGVSRRKVVDEQGAASALSAAGLAEDEYLEKKLKGIKGLEILLGKKGFEEVLGLYVDKPKGAPTLAPDTDGRADYVRDDARVTAAEAFTD